MQYSISPNFFQDSVESMGYMLYDKNLKIDFLKAILLLAGCRIPVILLPLRTFIISIKYFNSILLFAYIKVFCLGNMLLNECNWNIAIVVFMSHYIILVTKIVSI